MDIGFFDLKHPELGFANRDQTGGFGSQMDANGFVGSIIGKIKRQRSRLPVLSLAILSSIAKNHGHKTYFCEQFKGQKFDIYLIASSMAHSDFELAESKKIKTAYPNSKVGFIGPFASEFPDLYLKSADFVILGEPEDAFENICTTNVIKDGKIISAQIDDLDNLPFPDWSIFPIEKFGYFPSLPRKPFLTIQASRGCPFACEFCPYLVSQGIPLRRRSNEKIIEEIALSVEKYSIRSLLFRDITWSMNKKLTKDLCRGLIDRDFDLEIGVETRADTLDEELIFLMRDAGVKVVNLGIESPDDDILQASGRRPMKENKLENTLRLLEAASIEVQAFYILGLIDDTVTSMQQTVAYSRQLNTYTAQFCVLTPFPGTKTFTELEPRLLTRDFSKFNEYEPVVQIQGATASEISEIRDRAFSGYYPRLNWLSKHFLKLMRAFFILLVQR